MKLDVLTHVLWMDGFEEIEFGRDDRPTFLQFVRNGSQQMASNVEKARKQPLRRNL